MHFYYVWDKNELKTILDKEFLEWSNFDNWDNMSVQKLIFCTALDLHRGKKIDIKCDCCEYNAFSCEDFGNIEYQKCCGKKSEYILQKIVNEIVKAENMRESDGKYLT